MSAVGGHFQFFIKPGGLLQPDKHQHMHHNQYKCLDQFYRCHLLISLQLDIRRCKNHKLCNRLKFCKPFFLIFG